MPIRKRPHTLAFGRALNGKRRVTNRQIDFVGWLLFLASASAFVIASIGNAWAFTGSLFFLLA